MDRICVLGLGYIGLPTAALTALNGCRVTGVDIRGDLIEALRRGEASIDEPDLALVVEEALHGGTLVARSEPVEADVFMIAVPTPITDEKRADLSFVVRAAEMIAPFLAKGNLVIIESTVPPRASEKAIAPILERSGLKAGADFLLAYCPERVIPGDTLNELINNDRVVGGVNEASAEAAARFYRRFTKGEIFKTEIAVAEFVKLIENTFRDVNIALSNELALMGDSLGVDVRRAISLANRHPRVDFLRPGPGVGGHCIPVDPWFLVESCVDYATLISASRTVNDRMPERVAASIIDSVARESNEDGWESPVVAVLGLTYKENVSDLRESPAMRIVERLVEAGVTVKSYDPFVIGEYKTLTGALEGADLMVVLVGHAPFGELDPRATSELMRSHKVFDAIGFLDAAEWREAGFFVETLGDGHGSEQHGFVEVADEAA